MHYRTVFRSVLALVAALVSIPSIAAPVQAIPAAKFYQAVGVNTHAWYDPSKPWGSRLTELGVANVRGKVGTSKDYVTKLQPFFQAGGKINATIVASSGGTLSKTDAQRNLAFLKTNVGLSHVSGVEGPNEFNINHTSGWAAVERDFVKWLHDTVRADPAFNGVPIIAPSVWKRILADYQALGDLSAWVDEACIHYYSGQRRPTLTGPPSYTMKASLDAAWKLAPGKPMRMTETGWQAPAGNIPISNRAAAKYVVRDYFDAYGYGVHKIFMYQLMDDQTNLFGLTDANANPKPQFDALKNMVALVKDETEATGSLDYSLSGAPSTLKQMLLKKSDGSFLLALWLDVDSYSTSTKRDTVVTPANVTLSLAVPATATIYAPTFNAAAVKTVSAASVPVAVSDEVTIVKVN